MLSSWGQLTVRASALIAERRASGLLARPDIRRCGLHGTRLTAIDHDEPAVSARNDEMPFVDRDEGRVLRRERHLRVIVQQLRSLHVGNMLRWRDESTPTTGSDSEDDEASGYGCVIVGSSQNSAAWLGLLLAAGLMVNCRRGSSRARSAC